MAFYEGNGRATFVIGWTADPKADFGIYARGYRRSAEKLAEDLLGRNFADYDAYPVIFLYRHSLELALKHIIYRCAVLAHFRSLSAISERLHSHHRLVPLANLAGQALGELFPSDRLLSTLIPSCRQTCEEMEAIDATSFSFRYPVDTKGQRSTSHHLVIDLAEFATHMSALLEELDTVYFGLAQEIYISEDDMTAFEEALNDNYA